ncbi:MAG: adenine deaminase [Chloroflexi bacterium]|nr:adenine deaminase [Chloroflexota bacterium]
MLSQLLVNVVMGRTPADLVIKNGRWVCVQTGEIIPKTDIAVVDGHIAYVGENADHTIGMQTEVLDAGGRYLVPGLLDAHMHVESGMVTISEFVRAVVPHGTTGMFVDPHEIANVFGLKGVKLMVDEAAAQLVHVFVQAPSCVPSAPGMETPGATISPADVAEAMTWPGIIGLGEMMNFPGVIASDEKMHAEMHSTRHANKTIGGHYASLDLGLPFHAYAAGGPEDDHEGTRPEDAIARARQGMKVMMRYGSSWHDVVTQMKAVTKYGLDPRHFLLCTDDCHAETLANDGHIDRVVRHAIGEGLAPMTAIQMATINSADHFGVSRDMGQIAPGRWADILFVDDLKNFQAQTVIAKGKLVSRDGKFLAQIPAYPYPAWAKNSTHLPRTIIAQDFRIPVDDQSPEVTAHVIGVIENQAPTKHLTLKMKPENGELRPNISRDIAKIALIERHRDTGAIQVALVSGFGFTNKCAVATTVSHDCHNMLIVGTDEASMAVAANRLKETGGGQVVVRNGTIIGEVQLPIAGLMSNQPVEIVAREAASVLDGFKLCGSELNSPNMQLALLGLVVIPELRISDKGLVDVNKFEFIPVFEK